MKKRIQRKRTKGWKMPPNAVYVGRPSPWGNPFIVGKDGTREECVRSFRDSCNHMATHAFKEFVAWMKPLRGKDLACWCPLKDKKGNKVPCHADILLEILEEWI